MLFNRKGFKSRKYGLLGGNQLGITLIEALMSLSIAVVIISGILILINEESKQTTLKAAAGDFVTVLNAVARRTQHDGYAFDRWQENGNRADDGNAFITWDDTDAVVDTLFKIYLTGRDNPTCGDNAAGWNPQDLNAPENMDSEDLVSCILFENRRPFNTELSALMASDGAPDNIEQIADFRLYLDMDVSNLNEEEDGVTYIAALKRYIESNFNQNFDNRPSSMTVEFGQRNDLDDIGDDIEFTAFQCSQNLAAGNDCDLILALDFDGATNDIYLRTDGANSMLNGIDFRQGVGAPLQECIWWQNPDEDPADFSRNSGGNNVAVADRWQARRVDCGIFGGSDSAEVEVVVDQQHANQFLVAPVELNHYCRVYEATAEGEFQDIPDAREDSRVPCGMMQNGDIIQLAVENAFIGQAFIKDLIVQDIFSNSIEVVNPAVAIDHEVEDNLKLGAIAKVLTDYIPEVNILINIMDENRAELFTVDSNGYTHVRGEFEVEQDGVFRQDLLVEGDLTVDNAAIFNMTAGNDVVFGDGNELVFNQTATDFDMLTRSGVNLNLIANNSTLNLTGQNGVNVTTTAGDITIENTNPAGDININASGDLVLDAPNGAYLTTNQVTDTYINRAAFDALDADDRKDLELLNYGFGKYLDDKNGNISIHSTVNIESGSGNIIAKPDCLDFVRNNTTGRYTGTNAQTRANAGDGFDLARLFILPLYFKTYASALGNNQIFSQHAVHTGSDEWEVYMYLSGEGIQGTGGREDAAGSAIGLIVCDYNGVNFEG